MTFRDYLLSANKAKVLELLLVKHDKTGEDEGLKQQYASVIQSLLDITKGDGVGMPWYLSVVECDNEAPYINVAQINKGYAEPTAGLEPWGCIGDELPPEGYYNANDSKYSKFFGVGFSPWAELIDLEVELEPSKLLGTMLPDSEHIAMELLWELTFYGFSEAAVASIKNELLDTMEDAKLHPEKLVPLELGRIPHNSGS